MKENNAVLTVAFNVNFKHQTHRAVIQTVAEADAGWGTVTLWTRGSGLAFQAKNHELEARATSCRPSSWRFASI